MTLDKALEENPALAELEKKDERVRDLLDGRPPPRGHDAPRLRPRGRRRHRAEAAHRVRAALQEPEGQDEITTQWAMKEIERVGLLKMDFLGLSTLTLLDDAVKHIKATTGIDLDLEPFRSTMRRPISCSANGQTHGVFQFESSGMRDTLRKAKPQCLEDLIALNALYRPGPLRGGVVDDYIARKHGRVEIKYELPQMEPVLKETYGVIAYQEQVMRLASELAGFTLGQADELRARWARRTPRRCMAKQREAFMSGARANGITEKKATQDLRAHRVLRRATASTSRTRRPTRCSRIRRRISRRTIRGTSWRRC